MWELPAALYWRAQGTEPLWEGGGFWQRTVALRWQFNSMQYTVKGLRVPVTQGFEIFKLLQRRGIPSKLILFPEENHWILRGENNRYFFRELFAWLEKYTGVGLKEAEK